MSIRDQTRRHAAAVAIGAVVGAAVAPALTPPRAFAEPQAPAAARVNPVIAWDVNAQKAFWDVGRQLPWIQGRRFAMVHAAVFNAVNAIAGTP